MAVLQALAFLFIYRFFVLGPTGQSLDTLALASNTLGADQLALPVNTVLDAISIAAVAAAIGIIGFIALIRRRVALAVTSVVLVVGANATVELLKRYLDRPDLGIDEARAGAGNSFPSGHTAIAASVVVALVLVLPPAARGIGAVIGSFYAAIVGVATMSAGWHRPSDAVAAILIVGIWAALAGILLRFLRRRGERVSDDEFHNRTTLILGALGVLALTIALAGMRTTFDVIGSDVSSLSTKRLVAAYVGSSAGILSTSCFVMALILLTVNRVVPRRAAVTAKAPASRTMAKVDASRPARKSAGGAGGASTRAKTSRSASSGVSRAENAATGDS